jgi:four helix bundle protein
MNIRSYKDLAVWRRAMDFVSQVYQFSALLPQDERFGLVSQLRRAAVSVPANIAEGRQRSTTKDFLRFLSIAAGSLAELETLIELASRLHQLHSAQVHELASEADEVGKMLRSLQQKLEAKLPSP